MVAFFAIPRSTIPIVLLLLCPISHVTDHDHRSILCGQRSHSMNHFICCTRKNSSTVESIYGMWIILVSQRLPTPPPIRSLKAEPFPLCGFGAPTTSLIDFDLFPRLLLLHMCFQLISHSVMAWYNAFFLINQISSLFMFVCWKITRIHEWSKAKYPQASPGARRVFTKSLTPWKKQRYLLAATEPEGACRSSN